MTTRLFSGLPALTTDNLPALTTSLATQCPLVRVEVSRKSRVSHSSRACRREVIPRGEETRAAVRAIEMVERKDRVLIVEDEDNARKGYEQLLQRWGCDVVGVGTAEEALARFASYQPDTLIADVELPGMNGLDLLKQLGAKIHEVPAIVITGKGSEERAVAAIEAGAFWYIEKPLKGPVLRALLDRALSKARDARQLALLQRQLRETGRLGDLVGTSKPMQEVMRIVEMAAPSSASVLITGETGSGKEIVARTLHRLSPRANGPFVAINCSAIPETLMESEIFGHERGAFTGAAERRIGCFELADAGTLLLDEIARCPRQRRRSYCAFWKTAKCAAWGARVRHRWTCAFSRQQTRNPSRRSAAANCGKISTFA